MRGVSPAARDIVVGRRVPVGPPADPEPAAEDAMLQDQPPDTSASTDRAAVTSPAGVIIRPMEPADAGQVLAVYQAGLFTW
jgi:hypothetical protein